MWNEVKFKNGNPINTPKQCGRYHVTVKSASSKFITLADYIKETNKFLSMGDEDITDYVIAYVNMFTHNLQPYDDGRYDEFYNGYLTQGDIKLGYNGLQKYFGRTIATYGFNNIKVTATLMKSNYEYVTVIEAVCHPTNKRIYYEAIAGKEILKNLYRYITREIDYDDIYTRNDGWNVCLQYVKNNIVQPSDNVPTESGDYLCTCVSHRPGVDSSNDYKYLWMMHWDDDHKIWRDINQHGVSHTVLAWKKETICMFNDYQYKPGGYLVSNMDD